MGDTHWVPFLSRLTARCAGSLGPSPGFGCGPTSNLGKNLGKTLEKSTKSWKKHWNMKINYQI
jgi:hypothetical protein